MSRSSTYLGDGVYLSTDGYQLWLTTTTGDSIALEPKVFRNLLLGAAKFPEFHAILLGMAEEIKNVQP